jgi:hypothetical protein
MSRIEDLTPHMTRGSRCRRMSGNLAVGNSTTMRCTVLVIGLPSAIVLAGLTISRGIFIVPCIRKTVRLGGIQPGNAVTTDLAGGTAELEVGPWAGGYEVAADKMCRHWQVGKGHVVRNIANDGC